MFDPQHVRSWHRKRTYYTKKGQVLQAKAVDIPFTIESNKIEGYKQYLINNGLVRPPLQQHTAVIPWSFTKTIAENIDDSGLEINEILSLRFKYNKLGNINPNCVGYCALYAIQKSNQIGNLFSTLYDVFLHTYNSNSSRRNALNGEILFTFRDTDLYFSIITPENSNGEIGCNLSTQHENAYFGYSADEPGVPLTSNVIFPDQERIADNVSQFVNTHYVYLCRTENDDLSKNGDTFIFNKDPKFNILEQFSSVELTYIA